MIQPPWLVEIIQSTLLNVKSCKSLSQKPQIIFKTHGWHQQKGIFKHYIFSWDRGCFDKCLRRELKQSSRSFRIFSPGLIFCHIITRQTYRFLIKLLQTIPLQLLCLLEWLLPLKLHCLLQQWLIAPIKLQCTLLHWLHYLH